ncbi:angiopoietin-2-like [Ostrea edulis]|uniref:angiopoietin-2-like n=1 Tax=Ostrea edulis TaxID=37623 RepID=UPI0024AFF88E|nr:angiopoietin-2-like [Ostrea edulis]
MCWINVKHWAVDCREVREKGHTRSGVYKIKPFGKSSQAISVYCDMETSGGGWTAIQRRMSGFVDFNRTWNEYKAGFGIPEAYWIGNDVIHQLTKGGKSSLYVSISLKNDTTLYELYEQFSVSIEVDKYRLLLNGSATGTLGDKLGNATYIPGSESVRKIAAGSRFSAPDQDNDAWEESCAALYRGGWWFNACCRTFLNGPWNSTEWFPLCYPIIIRGTDVKETLMMIKPH